MVTCCDRAHTHTLQLRVSNHERRELCGVRQCRRGRARRTSRDGPRLVLADMVAVGDTTPARDVAHFQSMGAYLDTQAQARVLKRHTLVLRELSPSPGCCCPFSRATRPQPYNSPSW